jgi:hypothetical protein
VQTLFGADSRLARDYDRADIKAARSQPKQVRKEVLMAALRDYPPLSRVEGSAPRPSRLRVIIAVLLLSAIGLLAAASGFASKSYQHAPAPAPGQYQPPSTAGPAPDHC